MNIYRWGTCTKISDYAYAYVYYRSAVGTVERYDHDDPGSVEVWDGGTVEITDYEGDPENEFKFEEIIAIEVFG